MPTITLAGTSCGRTTLQTTPRGWSAISTQPTTIKPSTVTLVSTCRSCSPVRRSTSVRMEITARVLRLYAHNVSNHSTWLVADIFQDYSYSSRNSSLPGDNMAVLIGDTLYFDARDDTTGLSQLWAHDTSNRTTWKVHDASAQGGSMSAFSARLVMVLGDTTTLEHISTRRTALRCGRTTPPINPRGWFRPAPRA